MHPIIASEGKLGFVRLWMGLEEFPKYLQKGFEVDPTTRAVEVESERLIRADFPVELSIAFVRSVCRWGNYAGVAGRVIKRNHPENICSALKDAHIASQDNRVDDALEKILALSGLAVSFASKHLKFLDPTRNVVLDSIISARLGYGMTIAGYCEFVSDCKAIQKLLAEHKIPCPSNQSLMWRLADIEMAVFQKLRD